MCGIAAVIKRADSDCSAGSVHAMRDEVQYRGPDDCGSAFFAAGAREPKTVQDDDSCWTVGLGHRRLNILDLSPAGHQPMVYRNRFWIVYNGEVYNYIELRLELARRGHEFRSASDTEVILAAYAEWNVEVFQRLRGMWALAIYDTERNEVVLCRDRVGIKPLYFLPDRNIVAVVSEIKQLRHLPGLRFRPDAAAVSEYLATGYEDPSRTFFREIIPVPSGHWMRISANDLKISPPVSFWNPERGTTIRVDAEEAGHAFAGKFQECIRLHMRSDVPVGCALSGGLDSSSIAVVANQLRNNDEPLHTFTSTFPGDEQDERRYVDAVLGCIRGRPHFETPEPCAFLQDLERFVWVHDEPVGSMSVYAAYCIARSTRQAGVPVLLSGQGGDEVFGGYWQSYLLYLRGLMSSGRLVCLSRHLIGAVAGRGNPEILSQFPFMFRRYMARGKSDRVCVQLTRVPGTRATQHLAAILALGERDSRIYQIRTLLLPRLLKWDDRNSMAFSVEGRYPFLDHELLDLVLSFPAEVLYNKGWVKWPLRMGLRGLLPETVVSRTTKLGFETPQQKWMRGPLRNTLETWLAGDNRAWQYVDPKQVKLMANQFWNSVSSTDEVGQAFLRLFFFDRWLEAFDIS